MILTGKTLVHLGCEDIGSHILVTTSIFLSLNIPYFQKNPSMTFEGNWYIKNVKIDLDEVEHPGLVAIFPVRNRNTFVKKA